MGCCLLGILSAVWPRVILVLLWLFDRPVIAAGFAHVEPLWGILGFLFLPTTTLAYCLIRAFVPAGIDSPWLVVLGIAFLHDLGQLGMTRRKRVVVAGPGREKFVDPG